MRFERDSERLHKVLWYFVDDEALFMPFAHAFGSQLYMEFDDDLKGPGEVGPRPYYGGQKPCPTTTGGLCGDRDQWLYGARKADPKPLPWGKSTMPVCCNPPYGSCGGIAIGRLGFGACHMESTCDIYSPFGAANPTSVNVPCQFVEDLFKGRGTSPINTVAWTHYIDVAEAVSILDGCTRTATLNTQNYFDGDEVRIPTGGSMRFVVVWVTLCDAEGVTVKRCYLMRHSL